MSGHWLARISLILVLGGAGEAAAQSARPEQPESPRSLADEIAAQALKREALYERHRRDGDARYSADQVRDQRLRCLSASICDGCRADRTPRKTAAVETGSSDELPPFDPAVACGTESR